MPPSILEEGEKGKGTGKGQRFSIIGEEIRGG